MPHSVNTSQELSNSDTTLPLALVPLAQEIDAKIDAAFMQMRLWREERNRVCCATRKLPPEVLSMIFTLLMRNERSPDFQNYSLYCLPDAGRPRWLTVTYVCRQWRLAALSDPALWSDLTCVKGKWLERFIALSKASPLAFHYNAKPSDALKDPFIDRPERLGEAYLHNCTDKLLGRLNKATPFLSSLALRGVFSFRDEHHVSIPDSFLAGSAPRLHTFHMSSCTIPLRPSWLCNVQSLTLIGNWGIRSTPGQQEQLTISSFLEFIKPLKALAKLHVDLRQPQEPADNTYTGPTIHFAHLHSIHLDLGDGCLSSVELLSHIEAPSLASLEVVWPHHIFSSMEIDAVANASLNATDLIHQFFTKNTGASLSRLEWSINDVHSNVTLSSESNPPCSITLYNVLISVLNIPFEDVESIRTVEIGTSEALMTLDDTSDFASPWPFLDRVEVPAFALIPKNKCLPALKRWLKIRTGIRELKIIGLERLSERDVQPLEKILDVEWVW